MITKLADILHQLAQREAKLLGESPITHPTMIGTMYEGLTRDLLERALPQGLDLRIVGGLVIDGLGGMSGQIDCMLVRGEGEPVPYSPGQFRWHVKDVLAVFEVKKTLFAAELSDAYLQVRSVLDRYHSWIQNAKSGEGSVNVKASLRAYSEITREVAPPGEQWQQMPKEKFLILHALMTDQLAPLRIIFGYEGYVTERGLRKGFLDFIGKNLNAFGFGPPSFPNLIVAKGGSLVKMSGHPFRTPLRDNGRWPIMASARVNPLQLVLEFIWTRLSYEHNMAALFGEDLEVEVLAPLLDAEPVQGATASGWGWQSYAHEFTEAQLKALGATEPWSPVELDADQFAIVNALCKDDIALDDSEFVAFLTGEGLDPELFVGRLVATSLVAIEDGKLTLTTIQCGCVMLPDGRRFAADDNTGRLSRWVKREVEAWKKNAQAVSATL